MVNASLSNGLTRFLTIHGGVNSGFMIVQYTAASMARRTRCWPTPPAWTPSPPPPTRDFVSMGTTAARKAGTILENTRSVLAYELLTACQAIDIRRQTGRQGTGLSPAVEAIFNRVRREVPYMEEDREALAGHPGRGGHGPQRRAAGYRLGAGPDFQ